MGIAALNLRAQPILRPACFAPGLLLFRRLEGPGDKAALLLALSHLHGLYLQRAGLFQGAVNTWQVAGLGNQAAKPQHLLTELSAFLDQAADKGRLAALAPKLRRLTAEVQHRQFALGVELAEVAP